MTPPRPLVLLLWLALLIASMASPVGAKTQPTALQGGSPDVLILVAATATGQDQIGVTYPKVVPHAQARRDLAALQAATGWLLKRIKITDAPSSLRRDKVKMTGSECVASRAVRQETHGLAVQPFVQAFRGYHYLLLTYFVGADFRFRGLHDYSDNDLRIKLDQHGSAYTYQIFIRRPNFERLKLPYLQPPLVSGVQIARAAPRPVLRTWLIALVAVAAAGAGCAVYALLSRTV